MMSAEEAAEAAKGLTFEKVWAMFQESGRRIEEMSRNANLREAEVSQRIEEMSRNANLREAEVSRRIEETWKRIDREREEARKRIDREWEETRRIVKRLSKNIGGVNNSLGKWMEKMDRKALGEVQRRGLCFYQGRPLRAYRKQQDTGAGGSVSRKRRVRDAGGGKDEPDGGRHR
jgi:hypothetical protein